MADLSEIQRKNLSAVAECQHAYGRRLYAGQEETNAKTLSALVKLGLLDTELANDKVKTYGLTDSGEEAFAGLA